MRIIENLVPGEYYHIYNRGINRQDIFREEMNYEYFLNLYLKYVPAVADTYCYCLLKNHFHFLIKIKEFDGRNNFSPHKPIGNVLNAYAQGFNKVYERTGSLFERPFKRKLIANESHFSWLVWYIHSNAQRHRLVDDFKHWPHSSYHLLLTGEDTFLKRQELLEWFGDREYFVRYHQQQNGDLDQLIIE